MSNKEVLTRLYNKVVAASGLTHVQFHERQRSRYLALNNRLETQMEQQRMTPEILNKRCTL